MPYGRFACSSSAALVIAVGLLMCSPNVSAQSEKVLHRFSVDDAYSLNLSVLMDAHGSLYGSTPASSGGAGNVFELTPTGAGQWQYRPIHFFNAKDGRNPTAGLVMDNAGNIYGTTQGGGIPGAGTAFELIPSGGPSTWTEKVLHNFPGSKNDGESPAAGMIFDTAGNLYGTTAVGGANFTGTVFELKRQPSGAWTEFVLYSFGTGSDAQNPYAGVIFDSAGNLYGTTFNGGENGTGAVFELSPQPDGTWIERVIGSLDSGSLSSLIVDPAGNLYGTTGDGGTYGFGSVFELSPQSNGSWNETILHSFNTDVSDGFGPSSSLTFDKAGNLYGATSSGGLYNQLPWGAIFKLTPQKDGDWSESVFYSFTGNNGSAPNGGGLVFDSAGNLYGATKGGGLEGSGLVFEITP